LALSRHHSADYRAPFWSVDSTEANRALAYWRAGGYYPEPMGHDGFSGTNTPLTGQTDLGLHSADYRAPEWVLDGTEVSRVLAYWRIGAYHLDATGLDGYAPSAAGGGAGRGGGDAVTVTQSTGAGYHPSGTTAITNTFSHTGQLLSLLWRASVPSPWQIQSVSGNGGPEYRQESGEIVLTGALSSNVLETVLHVAIPLWDRSERSVLTEAEYQLAGSANYSATNPEPIALSPQDSDGDGLPDGWEEHYSGDPTGMTANADTDQDGATDFDESVAGTDPTNRHSVLTVRLPAAPGTNGVLLQWPSVTNRFYSVARSTNLLEGFNPVATDIPATAPTNLFTDPIDDRGHIYYHLNVEAP